jgi:hypothetical protein
MLNKKTNEEEVLYYQIDDEGNILYDENGIPVY